MHAHVAVDERTALVVAVDVGRDIVPVDLPRFVIVTHRLGRTEIALADEVEPRLPEAGAELDVRRSRAGAQLHRLGQRLLRDDLSFGVERHDHRGRFPDDVAVVAQVAVDLELAGEDGVDLPVGSLGQVLDLPVGIGVLPDYPIGRRVDDDHRIAASGEDLPARNGHARLRGAGLGEDTVGIRNIGRGDHARNQVDGTDARMRLHVRRRILDIPLFGTYRNDVLRPTERRFDTRR